MVGWVRFKRKSGSILLDNQQVEQWEEQLQSYEYVVLFYPNEVFKEGYKELFREPETIDQGTIYRVNKEGQKLILDYIGKTGIKDFR